MRHLMICAGVSLVVAAGAAGTAKAHDPVEHALETARVETMQEAALAFLSTLDDAQRATVMASIEDEASRTNWSNLPVSMVPRSGIAVAQMNATQRIALHAMMSAALSSQGYLTTTTIMSNEDVLHNIIAAQLAALPEDNSERAEGLAFIETYDAEKFYVLVFGDPQGDDWGWTVTGHHYAANFTVSDGRIAFTPLFLGANPQIVQEGRYAGWRLLQHEADRALALIGSLEAPQLERSVISDAVDNQVFAGPGRQDRYETQLGIRAADLNPIQLRFLEGLMDEFLDDASDEAAARQRLAIEEDGSDTLHFAWWGPIDDPAARFMFRIQGPSILIDYVRESSRDGGFNHVHSIVRDPSNDYGAEWLERHYDEAHQD
jgi:hypothetical protein